jgi:putative transcriptional regulator
VGKEVAFARSTITSQIGLFILGEDIEQELSKSRGIDSLCCGISKGEGEMKKTRTSRRSKASVGRRIIASLREAVDWAEGKDIPVRVTTVEVPIVDVRATRRRLGLSQASFAAKFGFQTATVRNWEQGRTWPDGNSRVLLAVIASHPEAVEDALRRAS